MYQKDVTGEMASDIVVHFNAVLADDERYRHINLKFFNRLISHFDENIDLNVLIDDTFDGRKNLNNASLLELCVMKVAIIEMIFEKTDIPVIINEYVEIAKEFVGDNVAGFVNAMLDKISSRIERKCQTEA
jgi:N utilization substance protein B